MKEDKEILSICPMKNYKTPDYPILEYANDDASFLKKLPQRWKKSAAVFICIGLLGTSSLSGCSSIDEGNMVSDYEQVDIINFESSDLVVRTHHGGAGAGGGSFYVVYLTEQETLGFIRAQLEAVGLNLNADLPSYEHPNGWDIDFTFFDKERGVAIIFSGEWPWGLSKLESIIDEEFLEQHNINAIGEFFCYGVVVGWGGFSRLNARLISSRQSSSQRTTLNESLADQVQEFITQLRTEGIL